MFACGMLKGMATHQILFEIHVCKKLATQLARLLGPFGLEA